MYNELKISVIIPVYNTEKYIKECITSVMNQTFRNFEVLVVDDFGTDNSIGIVTKYINDFDFEKKIQIIKHSENRGLSAARNTGIQHATGNFIYFLDSDDFLPNDAFENLVKLLYKYPHSDIVCGNFKLVPDRWMECFPDIDRSDLLEYYDSKKEVKHLLLNTKVIPELSQNKLINIDFIRKNNLFFKDGIIHEDTLYTFYLAKFANRIAFCKYATYFYRKNGNGIMLATKKELHALMYDIIIQNCIRQLNRECLIPQLKFILNLVHSNLILGNQISPSNSLFIKTVHIINYLIVLILHRT